jgi:hypothetical protein
MYVFFVRRTRVVGCAGPITHSPESPEEDWRSPLSSGSILPLAENSGPGRSRSELVAIAKKTTGRLVALEHHQTTDRCAFKRLFSRDRKVAWVFQSSDSVTDRHRPDSPAGHDVDLGWDF